MHSKYISLGGLLYAFVSMSQFVIPSVVIEIKNIDEVENCEKKTWGVSCSSVCAGKQLLRCLVQWNILFLPCDRCNEACIT